MGYACPVCEAEQADAEHLANHLAITASLGREEHREWLEEHAPEWADCNPAELGEIVGQYAPEIDTPDFEGSSHVHDPEPGRPAGLEEGLARQGGQPGRGAMTSETESVLQEALELTQRMQADGSEERRENGDGEETGDESE